jgi:hypothetical protein
MQRRATIAYVLPALVGIAGFTAPTGLTAQAQATTRPNRTAIELDHRSRSRAVRWALGAPVIHCAPAPLTERPGASAALSRPAVAPLEEAFLDAAIVKRTRSRVTSAAAR